MAGPGKKQRKSRAKGAATPAPAKPRPVLSLVPPPAPREPSPLQHLSIDDGFVDYGLVAALPLLEKACERTRGRYAPATVAQGVRAGALGLWLAVTGSGEVRALVITHIGKYDTGLQVLQLILAAGSGMSRAEVVDAIDDLRDYANARECERIEFHGARKGWLRWLRALDALDGFDELGVCGEMGV